MLEDTGSQGWYSPKRDGSLKDYFSVFDGVSSFPTFKGYAQYRMLWNSGCIVPDRSVIRLMWGDRGDEGFYVRGEHKIEGMDDIKIHTARSGIHDPEDVLDAEDCPVWEARNLSREPEPRKHE